MILDMHVHTTYSSCSRLRPSEILENARKRGLEGVCITDHNTMAAQKEIKEGLQPDGLCVLFGMEYDTPEGDFLVFGPFENLKTGMNAKELLNLVKEREGIAVAAHPYRIDRSLDKTLIEQGLCRIVESVNGRNQYHENFKVKELAERYDLVQCGGSDAHQLSELGKTATCFAMPITNRQDLIHALREGACTPCQPSGHPAMDKNC
jgi:predicted metal-dependent phosphoesterase TrpH